MPLTNTMTVVAHMGTSLAFYFLMLPNNVYLIVTSNKSV